MSVLASARLVLVLTAVATRTPSPDAASARPDLGPIHPSPHPRTAPSPPSAHRDDVPAVPSVTESVMHGTIDPRARRRDNASRHIAWWRPTGCGTDTSCQNATLTSLRRRWGAWDTFSPTVARVYNGTDVLDMDPLSRDVVQAIVAAQGMGYRVVPILEVDCGKVIGDANSSADYTGAISALATLASTYKFDGYTLDMICGDLRKAENTTTARFRDFVARLHEGVNNATHTNGSVVNWFAHGGRIPLICTTCSYMSFMEPLIN